MGEMKRGTDGRLERVYIETEKEMIINGKVWEVHVTLASKVYFNTMSAFWEECFFFSSLESYVRPACPHLNKFSTS